MKDFTYENQGTNTYLVYEVEDTTTIDEMSLGMLTNNDIPGLCKMLYNQLDTTGYLKYNISAKLAVSNALSGVVNRNRFVGVLRGIANSMLAVDDYMLESSCILFDPEKMFMDVATGETELVYLPLNQVDFEQPDLINYLKTTMFSLQFDQSENTEYVGRILNYLNSATVLNPQELIQLLDEIEGKRKAEPEVKKSAASTPVSKPISSQPVQPAVTPAPAQFVQNSAPASQYSINQKVLHPSKELTPSQATVPPTSAPVEQPAKAPKAAKKKAAPTPDVSFSIPGGGSMPASNPAPAAEAVADGEEISLFYLLQHYNKDNAAKYKAQKAQKKAAKGGAAQQPIGAMPQNAPKVPPMTPPMVGGDTQSAPQVIPQQVPQQPMQQAVQTPVQPAPQVAPVVPQERKLDFGNTTVLNASAGQGTTVLTPSMNTSQPSMPYLMRSKNRERINISNAQFKLGTEPSYADYCIRDNSAVSHSHAYISVKAGDCYIVDTNSTNHTYVNGSLIPSNQEVLLSDLDEITLANELFTFHK